FTFRWCAVTPGPGLPPDDKSVALDGRKPAQTHSRRPLPTSGRRLRADEWPGHDRVLRSSNRLFDPDRPASGNSCDAWFRSSGLTLIIPCPLNPSQDRLVMVSKLSSIFHAK